MPSSGLIGGEAIGETPSEWSQGAAEAVIFNNDRVIYAAEIHAGTRGYGITEEHDAIGSFAIGEGYDLVRVVVDAPLYIATEPFRTDNDQTPASTPFRGRFASLSSRRSINNGSNFGGVALGDGELAINNSDGAYDYLITRTIAGRDVIIRAGLKHIPYEYWKVLFRGTAREWTFDETLVRVAIRDRAYRLMVPIQPTLYDGSGGIEGDDTMLDKRKPLCLGYCRNVQPPRIDSANLVYQLNDGAVDSIFAVRDSGLPLSFGSDRADYGALTAATIAPGSYDTCKALGIFRLGASPSGAVTADAATYRSSGKSKLSTIVRGIIADRTDVDDFYEGSFTVLAALYPDDHGIYHGENDNKTVRDVLDELLTGIGGYVWFMRAGACAVGVIQVPDNPANLAVTMANIIDLSLERLPSRLSPPSWRLRVAYDHNFTQQSALPGAADAYFIQPWKVLSASDPVVLLDHPLAQDGAPLDTYMIDNGAGNVAAEVTRQFEIYSEERQLRRFSMSRKGMRLEIGHVVDLWYDRMGGRRLGVVVEDDIDLPQSDDSLDTIEVVVYG